MKLRYLGGTNHSAGPLIVAKHSYEKWEKDEVKEVDDQKGHVLMAEYPGRFEEIISGKTAKSTLDSDAEDTKSISKRGRPPKSEKLVENYKNK